LINENQNDILEKLIFLMKQKKIYLKKGLKLEDVAEKLELTSHALSQYINTRYDCKFNDFINQYRVEHAKKILASDSHTQYSFDGIAKECGFNNRTSFYRAFKKHTGLPPKAFKTRD
jgi:YesN/AraC family two-component response regulator